MLGTINAPTHVNIVLFKVNYRNTRKGVKYVQFQQQKQQSYRRCRSGALIINFKNSVDFFLVLLLLIGTGKCLLGMTKFKY